MAKWDLTVEIGGGLDYHVKAHCSNCRYEHFSREYSVGSYEYVFSAFIIGPEEEAKKFALHNAEMAQKYPYCPMCGEKMEE